MTPADLRIVRDVHKRRIDAALLRSRADRFGQLPGIPFKLWSLGSWLASHDALDELTPAEREYGMTVATYIAFAADRETLAEGEKLASTILHAAKNGGDTLTARRIPTPVSMERAA